MKNKKQSVFVSDGFTYGLVLLSLANNLSINVSWRYFIQTGSSSEVLMDNKVPVIGTLEGCKICVSAFDPSSPDEGQAVGSRHAAPRNHWVI